MARGARCALCVVFFGWLVLSVAFLRWCWLCLLSLARECNTSTFSALPSLSPPLSLPISLSLPIPFYLSLSSYLFLSPYLSPPYLFISHGLAVSLVECLRLSLRCGSCACAVRYALDATGCRPRLRCALDAERYQSAQDHGARMRRGSCAPCVAPAGRRVSGWPPNRQHTNIFLIYYQHMPTGGGGRPATRQCLALRRPAAAPLLLFLGCVILCAPVYHLGHVRFNSSFAV